MTLKRREFITLLGSAAVAGPLAAHAQQGAKLPIIGYVGGFTPATRSQSTAAFVQRLRALGWIEGRTVTIEYRWAEGRSERFPEIVAEFIRLKVDVIVTEAAAAVVAAARQAKSVIPVVFFVAGDPIGMGLVASLPRPGGNVTGLSNQATDLASKRLEFLRAVVPNFHRLAVLANADYGGAASEESEIAGAARALDVEVAVFEVRRTEDIAPAFEALKARAEALYVVGDGLVNANRVRINTLALAARLPAIYVQRDYVDAGGLMSYGADFQDLFRRTGDFVDKILRGAKPADIPVEQPTKFELIINLTTAKALGLTVPDKLLALADDVIE
jgi:putative ABC transport system substrate-binding protein